MKTSGVFFAAILLTGSVNAQDFRLNCVFTMPINGRYTCQLFDTIVPDNINLNFVIGGVHTQGRNNNNVQQVIITDSRIPFIISQFFTTFPNLLSFTISEGGLTRIQPNAFANAQNVESITLVFNPDFHSIEANAFSGLIRVSSIQLNSNGIDSINETAFNGLTQLSVLSMRQNYIRTLPENLFATLQSLRTVFFHRNSIYSLSGQLFANNRNLEIMSFNDNKINAIGSSILDGLTNLQHVGMLFNKCVSNSWNIGGSVTVETIRVGLTECFNNSPIDPPEPEDELRRFVIEVRGPFTMRFENGTHIVTV
jgi:hypothetical protein